MYVCKSDVRECMYVCMCVCVYVRGGCGGHLLVEDPVGEERVVVDAENLHRRNLVLAIALCMHVCMYIESMYVKLYKTIENSSKYTYVCMCVCMNYIHTYSLF